MKVQHTQQSFWSKAGISLVIGFMLFMLTCTSCTLYYDATVRAGSSPEQAHRQALLIGANAENETKDRRQEEREKRGFRWFDIDWD